MLAGMERRAAPPEAFPRAPLSWLSPLMSARSSSGKAVTAESSLEVVAVWSAVSLLAGAIGSLPLKVYGDGTIRREARSSRQWRLLGEQPNPEMAADEFWEFVATSLLLWGNAYVWKRRDANGLVSELWPISPARVGVGRADATGGGTVRCYWLDGTGRAFESDILHIRGLGMDANVGLSPIQLARQTLGNQMSLEEFQGAFWRNGAFFSAALQHPNQLSEVAQKRLANQLAQMSGAENAGSVFVFEEGMTYVPLTMPLEDAQFLEQSKLTDLRVAQLFRVPPYMLGAETAKSMTYSNSEMESLDFVKWSLRRWLVRIERAVNRDTGIFPPPGKRLACEFDVDALLRADTKSRYEAHQIAIGSRFKTINEVRVEESLPPVDGGDSLDTEPDAGGAPIGADDGVAA